MRAVTRRRERRCVYRGERARRLSVIERILQVVGGRIGRAEVFGAERFFGEMQNAAELVLHVRNVTRLHDVGRDEQQRNAEAQLVVVAPVWHDVVEEAAPVVPSDDDGGRIPVRTLPNGVHDGCHPRGAAGVAVAGVVAVLAVRRHPGDRCQRAGLDVVKNPLRLGDDEVRIVAAFADVLNRIVGMPQSRTGAALVVAPGDPRRRRQQIAERLTVETGVHRRA